MADYIPFRPKENVEKMIEDLSKKYTLPKTTVVNLWLEQTFGVIKKDGIKLKTGK